MKGGLLQRLLGGGGLGSAAPAAAAASAAQPDFAIDDLVDVRFDERNQSEAELAQLFDGYERALRFDRQVADEMLLAFFERFATACTAWQPAPAAIEAARAAATAASAAAAAAAEASSHKSGSGGSFGRRAQVQLVVGCSGGHPRALLAALVEGLERAPRALGASAAAGLGSGAPLAGREAVSGEAAGAELEAADAALVAAASREQGQERALLHAAGLPLLRALRVLLRSQHNRAVLCSLGLLPTLCQLARQLAQKLQAAAGVLALCSGDVGAAPTSPGGGTASRSSSSSSVQQLRLLRPLMALLQETLVAVQEFAEAEVMQSSRAAVASSQAGNQPGSPSVQQAARPAAAAGSAGAAGSARAASHPAAAVAPMIERGLLELCCSLLPLLLRIQLHSSGSSSGGTQQGSGGTVNSPPGRSGVAHQGSNTAAAAAATELQALRCVLALQAASPAASAAALLQPAGGQPLATLVQLLGWPVASAEHQLPLSSVTASSSSANLAATAAAPAGAAPHGAQQAQQGGVGLEEEGAGQSGVAAGGSRYVRANRGGGLRPAAGELQLQLLALRAVGAAAWAGGSATLRLLQQQGCFLRLVQLLQWAALTFDVPRDLHPSPTSAGPVAAASGNVQADAAAAESAAAAAANSTGADGCVQLQRIFEALWGWLGGGSGSGTAKALLPLLLGSVLAAFQPAPPAGPPAPAVATLGSSGVREASGTPANSAPPLQLLKGSDLANHQAAVAALRHAGDRGASDGGAHDGGAAPACGCALQQQVLLLAARLLGREQRVVLLLPAACQELFAEQQQQQRQQQARGSGGGGSASEALVNLAVLRASGLWEVALGPAFFFWAAQQEADLDQQQAQQQEQGGQAEQQQEQQQQAEQQPRQAVPPATRRRPSAADALRSEQERLRRFVLAVVEAAATLPSCSSNLAEVSSLLGLLRSRPCQHSVAAATCRLLLRLLGAAPDTTLAALQEQHLLGLLPRLLAQQAQHGAGAVASVGAAAGGRETSQGDEEAPDAEVAALEDARCAALELLGGFISLHASLQRDCVAAWEPVAALFSLLLQPQAASRRLALDNVLLLMQVPPAGEDDRLAKAALFTKYTETLPAAVARWRQLGTPLLLELLGGMRAVASGAGGDRAQAQRLFAQAQAFLQVCNVLNEEYGQGESALLCCAVLDSLSAMVAGNPSGRRAMAETVGYGMLLEAVLCRLGPDPAPRALLLSALGLLLEEVPGSGQSPLRFSSTAIANPAALPLLLSLLRHAGWEDQLWGLAAFRELLLQGVHNLAAADAAGLNTQVIAWLSQVVGAQEAATGQGTADAIAGGSRGSGAAEAQHAVDPQEQRQGQEQGEEQHRRLLLLRQQLLALLRLSGSYSISARDLCSLLHLLKPCTEGRPPPHAPALLEALASMAASTSGPSCFFNCSTGAEQGSSGGGGGRAGATQGGPSAQPQPSGIVCSASLGGGSAAGTAGSSSSFLRLPKAGYSFAIWVRLEDGREAAEQLQALLQPPHPAGGVPSARGGASTWAASALIPSASADQAVFALLHQQQQPASARTHSPFPFHTHQSQQLLTGVALAVRQVDGGTAPGASLSGVGGGRQQQRGPSLQLVAHCWAPKHAEAALPLQQPLVPGRWHHLALTHSAGGRFSLALIEHCLSYVMAGAGGPLSHSQLHLFLDGQLQATARLKYPSIKEPLSSVCVGAGALLRPLRGQAGAALLFEDVLAPGQVAALHQLGPDYQSPLIPTESSGLLDKHPAAAAALALGSGTGAAPGAGPSADPPPRLLLAFCPQLAAAALPLEGENGGAPPDGSGGTRGGSSRAIRDAVAGLPAALLAGTQLCRTRQPADMLHSLGGVAALLPLLQPAAPAQEGSSAGTSAGDDAAASAASVAAGVLRLLAAVLKGSPGNQQAMQEVGGFSLIAHLLEQQDGLLVPEVLAAQQQLLAAVCKSPQLSQDVLGHLLLNLRLWSAAAPAVQRQLLGLWVQLAQGEPLLVRSLLPPAQLLHHLRSCFFSGGATMRRRTTAAGTADQQQEQQGQLGGEAESAGQAAGVGAGAAAGAGADAALAAKLRRGYLQLACTLVSESAAAAGRQGGAGPGGAGGAGMGAALAARDEGLAADLQAALSLIADCCTSITARASSGGGGVLDSGSAAASGSDSSDAALLQELLSLLLLPLLRRDSLARLPLLACLHRQGGPALLLPLLRLEQQQLRVLGLRALTACLPAAEGEWRAASPQQPSASGGRSGRSSATGAASAGSKRRSVGTPQAEHEEDGGREEADVIAAAGRILAGFPLTPATRIALFEMLCDGVPWQQIDGLAPAGPPASDSDAAAISPDDGDIDNPSAAAALVRVRQPAAAAVLLQMAAASDNLQERAAVLGMLCLLCESASLSKRARQANQDMLAASPGCWQQLLDCLLVGSDKGGVGGAVSSASGRQGAGAQQAQQEAAAGSAWRLLVMLLARSIAASTSGAQWVHTVVSLLKMGQLRALYHCPDGSSGARTGASSPVASWQLLQGLLLNVIYELLIAQAADAAAVPTPASGVGDSLRAASSPLAVAAVGAAARAAVAGVHRAFSAGEEAARPTRRASSEWDAWTHVSQWSTEPYCSNAAVLLALLDDFLAGSVLAPPGGCLGPTGSALLWADPSAGAAGAAASPAGAPAATDAIPLPAWQELGAVTKQVQQQQQQLSAHLQTQAWRFLDRLHCSGAAAAADAALRRSSPAALLGALPAASEAAAGSAAGPGLSEQQLRRHQQQRGLLLLQRLLLLALQQAAPEVAQQAAAQAAQLLPPLLADAAADGAAAEAAVARLQLMLAAVVQCHWELSARAAAAQQQERLLPLQIQQRLAACATAANAIVDAAPWAFGEQQQAEAQQVQQVPRQQRPIADLLPLLQPRVVLAAARLQIQFARHCCGLHEAGVPALRAALQAGAERQHARAAAAEEACAQCLGLLLAADRLRRAAGRQAADEQRQLCARRWRDVRRGLASGRGLWAEEEDPAELHWKLDRVEDPSRRRLRLRRNYRFERYSDAPRTGKGTSAALAGPASGVELQEQELLAVAAILPGASQAVASPALPDTEALEDSEEGDEQAPQQAEQEEAGGAGSGAASPAQQAQAGGEGPDEAEQQQQQHPPEGQAEEQHASQPHGPGQAADDRTAAAAHGSAAAEATTHSDQRQHAQQVAAQAAAPTQQPAVQPEPPQQQQVDPQAASHQAPQLSILTSEDVEAPPALGASPALFSSRCQLVTPKRVASGQLHITSTEMHFVEDLPGGAASLAPFYSGSAAPGASRAGSAASDRATGRGSAAGKGGGAGSEGEGEEEEPRPPRRRHRRWPLAGLTEVHHSRYLLQPTALECFTADRRSHALFNLPSNQAMRAAAAALQRARPSVDLYDRRRKLEWALRLQQRWLRWEVSNFDYLMALNTLAGRTYADLNQYPVFPWVLADYTSRSLDLTNPATFRDLSKPMGALDEKRLQFFKERFEGLAADQRHGGGGGDGAPHLPPFHYGSHYSSAGIVLFYLIRLESFTRLNRGLQGGRFDHGDRLFHSIAATWQSCLDNTADVKELIPEFFYQPEFLRNSNAFDLGRRQDGAELGDVVLPPWAHGSAEEFVRVMREALESEHVSGQLHQWIDLIFGHKQRGKAAEEAVNVFYYLTYEGAADLDAIHDPTLRTAVEEQILHFGQTPIQLFRRQHPQRGPPPSPALNPLLNGPDTMRRSSLVLPPPHRTDIGVVQMWVADGRVTQVFSDGTVATPRWCPGGRQDLGAFSFGTAGLLLDTSGSTVEPDPLPPRLLAGSWAAGPVAASAGTPRRQLAPPYAVVHGDRVVLSGGCWDGSLRAHSPEDGRLLQSLCYHKDAVTCLAASSDGTVVVTGSADTTLMVWDANPAFGRVSRARQPQPLPLVPRPRCSLHGHRDTVTCVAVSPELDLVVSGAADGTLLLHSLGSGAYVRSLELPLGVPPTLLCVVPALGALLVHSHVDLALHLYSVNCRHLASADTHERLASLCPTPDGRLLLAAGTSGLATLRWLHSLKPVLRYDAGRGPITALALTPEGCFLAGTAEGSAVLFAPDTRRRITRRFDLAS